MKRERKWVKKAVLLGIVLVAAVIYFLVPPVKNSVNQVLKMFASGDFDVVRDFVASYGAYAAVASFFLMIFQSVAAPLPSFAVYFFRYRQLCGGTYIHVLWVIFHCDRDRTAPGNHCIFLCGRHADGRSSASYDRTVDSVCLISAGSDVKENIYGQTEKSKGRNKVMETYYNPEDLEKFGTIGEEAPALAEKFFDYYGAVFAEGALTAREKSLIALAVAHAVQCPYCIDSYTNDCLNKGVSEEQMTEAVHVAAAIRGGATLVHGVQMKNIVKKLEL